VEWANETPKGLWKKIVEEVQTYYGYRLDWLVMMSVLLCLVLVVLSWFTCHLALYSPYWPHKYPNQWHSCTIIETTL